MSVTYWLHIGAQCQLPTGFTYELSVSYLLASHTSSVSVTYWLHIRAQCQLPTGFTYELSVYWLHIRAQCQLPTGFTYELRHLFHSQQKAQLLRGSQLLRRSRSFKVTDFGTN